MNKLKCTYKIFKNLNIPNYALDLVPFLFLNANENKESAEYIKKKWEEHLESKDIPVLDFYIHIPFCMQRCLYCQERSEILIRKDYLESYIKYLESNINFFKESFKNIKFSNLNIGGGTPSLLSYEQIDRILTKLFENFNFLKQGEKTFEFDPSFIDEKKIRLLYKKGFNRLSFGVQTLDEKTLKNEGRRFQTFEKIKETMKYCTDTGFSNINIDLMMGLKDDSSEKFIFSFKEIVKLNPSTISIYPFNPTERYVKVFFKNNKDEYYKHYKKIFLGCEKEIIEIAEKNDYNGEYFDLDSIQYEFCKKGHVRGKGYEKNYPSSCFSIGKYSRSKIFKKMIYCDESKNHDFDSNNKSFSINRIELIDEKSLYIFRCLSRAEEIDPKEYKEIFGSELTDDFHEEIKYLLKINKILIKNGKIKFLPKNAKSRFFYSLLMVNNNKIMDKAKQ